MDLPDQAGQFSSPDRVSLGAELAENLIGQRTDLVGIRFRFRHCGLLEPGLPEKNLGHGVAISEGSEHLQALPFGIPA